MRFCYADPPYLKMGQKMYGKLHPEAGKWDDIEEHKKLIKKLCDEYDGWAYSCNPKDLPFILAHCPPEVRVCAWTKTFHQIRGVAVQYAWECVLLYGERKGKRKPMVRDWLSCSIAMKKGLQGSKPDLFNDWIIELFNCKQDDEVHDLFSGTKGLEQAGIRKNIKVINHTESI